MGMSMETADLLSYKFHVECFGRQPSKKDRVERAKQIIENGPAWVYATLFESDEGKARLAEDRRIRRILLAIGDEKKIK